MDYPQPSPNEWHEKPKQQFLTGFIQWMQFRGQMSVGRFLCFFIVLLALNETQ